MSFKREYRKLYKFYTRRLNQLHKISEINFIANMEYIFTKLLFLRDYYILTESSFDLEEDTIKNKKLATIIDATIAYVSYKDSLIKYNTNKKETNAEDYLKAAKTYWNTFWELVKDNMDIWLKYDEYTM